jgi:flotillin
VANAVLAEKEAEARKRGEVAEQQAYAEVQIARAMAETKRLEAEEVVPQEIARRKIQIEAQAEADRRRTHAQGEAEAILAIKEAEATGAQRVLEAKAEGYRQVVEACGGNVQEAGVMLLIEKLEELVEKQVQAISNLKIDKITVWDSGQEGKSSTANFVSNMVKSLPALHDVASMAGLELPDYLGKVGRAPQTEMTEGYAHVVKEDEATLSLTEPTSTES